MMIYKEGSAFVRDLKRLARKWRTLPEDIEAAKQVITGLYQAQEGVDLTVFRQNFFDGKVATVLSRTDEHEVVKMRLDCSSPGAHGEARLVFVFVYSEEVTFIELFSKSEKEREDEERIKRFVSGAGV